MEKKKKKKQANQQTRNIRIMLKGQFRKDYLTKTKQQCHHESFTHILTHERTYTRTHTKTLKQENNSYKHATLLFFKTIFH